MKLKPAIFALAAASLGVTAARGQTLTAGDIAVLQFNPSSTDRVVVMPLVNLAAGTSFTITDNGWTSGTGNGFYQNEGKLVFTVPTGGIRAGTLLKYENQSATNTTTGFSSINPANFALNATNDSLTIVRGTATAVTASTNISEVIYAIQSDASSPYAWDSAGSTAPTSARPQLSDTNLTPVMQGVNGYYTGTTTAADRDTWITRLGTTGNRTYSSSSQALMSTTSYTVVSNLTWTGSTTTWGSATTVTNWDRSSNTTWFNSGDNVTFGTTGAGAVSLVSGGVSSGNITFNASGYTIQSNTLTLAGTTPTISVTTAGHSATISSALAGSTGLSKSGAGTLNLTGTNSSNIGATSVTAGTLNVGVGGTGSLTSAVTVTNAGSTLGGSGTITGNVRINNGAILAPGNSPGVLTVAGTTTLDSSSIFSWELGSEVDHNGSGSEGIRGTNYDGLTSTDLTVAGGAVFRVILSAAPTTAFWNQSQTWNDIFSVSGTTTPAALGHLFNAFQVYNGTTDITAATTASQGYFTMSGSNLNWTAVPEPTTALAGLLLGAGLLRRRR